MFFNALNRWFSWVDGFYMFKQNNPFRDMYAPFFFFAALQKNRKSMVLKCDSHYFVFLFLYVSQTPYVYDAEKDMNLAR